MTPETLEQRLQRARAYLRAIGPAIEGQGGDDQTFKACKVGRRFDLSEGEFLPLLEDWNNSNQPPWRSDQLARKLRSTYRNTTVRPGAALGDKHRGEPPPRPADPVYPPPREVSWLWTSALPLADGKPRAPLPPTPASRWIESMGINIVHLGHEPALQVRAMPRPSRAVIVSPSGHVREQGDEYWPTWAQARGGRWCDLDYGAVIPLFDARGELRSVKARWTTPTITDEQTGEVLGLPPDGMKSVPPFGYDVRGLVMANAPALYLLTHGEWLTDIPRDQRELWIVEGETDFEVATFRLFNSQRPHRACMGQFSGSWTPAHARRVPRDTVAVINAQDPDRGGDKLAELVQRTLQGHVPIKRRRAR